MSSIRMLKNVILTVEFEGNKSDVVFSFGHIYSTKLIKQDDSGYSDVYLNDGSIIRGVANTLFDNNHVTVEHVDELTPSKSILIQPHKVTEEKIPLQGVSVSEQPIKDKTGRFRV